MKVRKYEYNYELGRDRERERGSACNCLGRKREGGAEREQRCKRIIEGGPNGTLLCASNFSGPCKWPAWRDSTLGDGGGGKEEEEGEREK